ncbi:MAG: YtxH domain-containing protein [Anaerolineales bacterium]|nr:YtxH domain-containing protein [Anaerolineales bacterium]MCA9930585.1 YtxH domain-containing protein [Anaerolineales bacterium]
MSENNNDLGAFLAGFVIGGLVGAATALILAPQSGEETRSQIAARSSDLRQAGGERVQQYRDSAESYAQQYRERAGALVEDSRSRIQDVGGRVQEQARIVLDGGKEQATRVRNQVSSLVQKETGENEVTSDEE